MAIDTTKPVLLLPGDNHIATATMSGSATRAGYGAANVKTASYAQTMRTEDATSILGKTLVADLGSSKSIEALVLVGVNLRDAATYDIRVGDDPTFAANNHTAFGLDAFDTTWEPYGDDRPAWGRPVIYSPSSTWAGRYVQWKVFDAGHPDGYIEIAHAFAGLARQPANLHPAWNQGTGIEGGAGRSLTRIKQSLALIAASEASRRAVLSVQRIVGLDGRMIIVPRPWLPASWLSEVGGLSRLTGPVEESNYHDGDNILWDLTLNLQEVTT